MALKDFSDNDAVRSMGQDLFFFCFVFQDPPGDQGKKNLKAPYTFVCVPVTWYPQKDYQQRRLMRGVGLLKCHPSK